MLIGAFAFLLGAAASFVVLRLQNRTGQAVADERLRAFEKELRGINEIHADEKRARSVTEAELKQERTAHGKLKELMAATEAKAAADDAAANAQIAKLLQIEQNLKDSFDALAGRALDASGAKLLEHAEERWKVHQGKAEHDLSTRQTAIDALLKPIQDSLQTLTKHSQSLELSREGAYQGVLRELQAIHQSHTSLNKETAQLVQALRSPRVRGHWGELQLKRCIEFAGMVEHASFRTQTSVSDGERTLRPDAEIYLPNQRTIVVDAKTPMESYLSATVAADEGERSRLLRAHAASVRQHMKDLAAKAYAKQFRDSPDFVICFLPSEVLFSSALEQDPSLIEFGAAQNVLLATPTTLIAMLKAIACGWQQASVAENARKIQEEATKIYSKLCGMQQDLKQLGDQLGRASTAYNAVLAKAEGQGGIFSVGRRLRELNIGNEDLPELIERDVPLRRLTADDWHRSLSLAASGTERSAL